PAPATFPSEQGRQSPALFRFFSCAVLPETAVLTGILQVGTSPPFHCTPRQAPRDMHIAMDACGHSGPSANDQHSALAFPDGRNLGSTVAGSRPPPLFAIKPRSSRSR